MAWAKISGTNIFCVLKQLWESLLLMCTHCINIK